MSRQPDPPRSEIEENPSESDPLHWGIGLLRETYDAIVVWSFGGSIRFWNRGAELLFGYTRPEATGRIIHELLQRAPTTVPMEEVERVVREQGRWEGELTHISKSGQRIITESRLLLAGDRDTGQYVVEANRDVTARRETEEALRRHERIIAATLDASLDAIISMDHRGCITAFNQAAEMMFGWKREEALGREMGSVIVPEHLRESHRRGVERYLQTGEPRLLGRRIEIEGMRADGSLFPVELAIVELPGVSPPTFTGFLRDITKRRRQEEELRRANEELERGATEERALRTVAERLTAAAHVPEVMQQIATGAIVVSAAAGAYVERVISVDGEVEVLGAAGEGAPPVGTRAPFPGSLTEEVMKRREPAFVTTLAGLGSGMATHLAGHCADCSMLVVPLHADDTILGALVLVRRNRETPFEFGVVNHARTLGDLASLALQRVMVLAEAERRRDEAEAAVRLRDEVLSIVSHDLRNPASTIAMSASLLEDPALTLDEHQRLQQVGVIRRSAERMNRLIQDLLDVARIEGGRFAVDCRCEDPAELVREACESFTTLLQDQGQRIDCHLAPQLPRIMADRHRVQQVLSNFLANASKFTPAGHAIQVRAWQESSEVRFAVIDEGPGIHPDELPRLFERFWQAKRTAHLGAGLGLAISKGIAEAHKGRVWAESELGRGSRFILALPISKSCA